MIKRFVLLLFCTACLSAQDFFGGPENTQSLSPPTHAPKGSGALNIIAYPPQTDIYINGKHVGRGAVIRELPVGQYEIYAAFEKKSKTETAYVMKNNIREVSMRLKRRFYLNLTPSFSQFWVRNVRSFGPGIQIELQHEKAYYGINFNWDFFDGERYNPRGGYASEGIGGAGFSWRYEVLSIYDVFILSPGFVTGYWYFTGRKYHGSSFYDDYYDYDYENSFEKDLFGGPALDLSVGYNRMFANLGYTLLFGSEIGHVLTLGMRVKI